MEKLIDLHTHTIYSDGDLTPDELIKKATDNNIGILSITDHDTVLAYKNITNTNGIEIIPGVELSAKVDKGRMHILGYGIDVDNKNLNKELNELKEKNIEAILMIADILKKEGVVISDKDISLIINRVGDVGRPDLARLLVDYGYAVDVEDAFQKYLIEANEKIKHIKKLLTIEECINLIKESNGVPVLAHPVSLKQNYKELKETLKILKEIGLMGIEVFHYSHTIEEEKKFLSLATQYDLLYSGGSDYHGPIVKPDIELGTGYQKNLRIKKLSVLDYLNER